MLANAFVLSYRQSYYFYVVVLNNARLRAALMELSLAVRGSHN